MTTADKDTGLPLLGAGDQQVPIDPAMLPELREKIATCEKLEAVATGYAAQLMKALAMGASIGAQYGRAEGETDQYIIRLLALHNLTPDQCVPGKMFDLEKGLINVLPKAATPSLIAK